MNSHSNSNKSEITICQGGLAVDDRGTVSFVNDFDFNNVRRFYQVENFSQDTIRAFHGHLNEGKYVYVVAGTIILAAVFLDNTSAPNKGNPVTRVILSSKAPRIVYIPPQYANGFKALEDNTKVIFFSTSTIEESKNDDYRFPADYWGSEIWEVENR